jgi:hypothetical protein
MSGLYNTVVWMKKSLPDTDPDVCYENGHGANAEDVVKAVILSPGQYEYYEHFKAFSKYEMVPM